MPSSLLSQLLTDEFADSIGWLPPAKALRYLLKRRPEVAAIARARTANELPDSEVRTFLTQLVRAVRPGFRFEHELAIAALLVALETEPTPSVHGLLSEFARLDWLEIRTVSEVAQVALSEWQPIRYSIYRIDSFGSYAAGTCEQLQPHIYSVPGPRVPPLPTQSWKVHACA